MSETGSAPLPELPEAPGWRRGLAGLIDASIAVAAAFARRRVTSRGATLPRALQHDVTRQVLGALAWPTALIERVGSPGERLLGVRTVDRRTGRRVALAPALLMTAASATMAALRSAVSPNAPDREQMEARHARFAEEAAALRRRHAGDEDALREAMMELWRTGRPEPVRVDFGRIVGVNAGLSLLLYVLRRRLAPTVVVMRDDLREP